MILFLRDVVCGIPPTHQRVFHRVLIFIDNVCPAKLVMAVINTSVGTSAFCQKQDGC